MIYFACVVRASDLVSEPQSQMEEDRNTEGYRADDQPGRTASQSSAALL